MEEPPKVEPLKGEDRKSYLIRVAIIMLEQSAFSIENVEYDGVECDAFCLADDLKTEFNL